MRAYGDPRGQRRTTDGLPELGYGFGAGVLKAGSFLVPNALAVLIVAPIAGAFAKRTSPLVPLVAATVLGIVTFAALAGHHDQQWQLYLGSAAWGTTVALGLVATFLLVVEAVPLADAGSAASIPTLGQAVGSAIGTAVFTAALTSELSPGTPVAAAGGYTRAFVAAALFAAAARCARS